MNRYISLLFVAIFLVGCNNSQETQKPSQNTTLTKDSKKKITEADKQELLKKGYKIIDFIDPKTKDTIVMQQYFMAFLKKGKNRSQNVKQADSLQRLHLAHLKKMYKLGYSDISGPFGELDGDIRGVTIYNVPTLEMADSLANADPAVKAGRLEIELHPWWAAKGASLR